MPQETSVKRTKPTDWTTGSQWPTKKNYKDSTEHMNTAAAKFAPIKEFTELNLVVQPHEVTH